MQFYPSMRRLMEAIEQDGWNVNKDQLNRTNHDGLSLKDGASVIANLESKATVRYEHGEERELYLGSSANGSILFVVAQFLDTGEDIPSYRIISVRHPPVTDKVSWRPAATVFKQQYAKALAKIKSRKEAESKLNG